KDLAPLADADHRRRQPAALLVDDDLGLPALHHGHHGVRGAEIDPDDLRHLVLLLSPGFFGITLSALSTGNGRAPARPAAWAHIPALPPRQPASAAPLAPAL